MRKRISVISSILSAVALLVSFGIGAAPASALSLEKIDGIGKKGVGFLSCERVTNDNVCYNPYQYKLDNGNSTWAITSIQYLSLPADVNPSGHTTQSTAANSVSIDVRGMKDGDYVFYAMDGRETSKGKLFAIKFKVKHVNPVVNVELTTSTDGKKQLHITFADDTTKDIDLGDLKGEKGDKGDQGPQGPKGDKGDPGAPGKDGKDGINGADGKDGKDALSGYNVYWLGGDYGVIFVKDKPAQGTDTPNFTVPSTITTNPVEVQTPQTQANSSESESAKQSQTSQSQENNSKADEKSDSKQSADTETQAKPQLNKKHDHALPPTGVGVALASISVAVLAGVGVALRKVRR